MKNMTLENIRVACDGSYVGAEERKEFCVSAVSTDSRHIEPGCLFVAIPGARADGHSFIPDAFSKGAAAVICERVPESPGGPCICVDSSLAAIKDIAEFYRQQLGIPIVGITGSAGKTSTKEMTASVLEQRFRVLKTEGNLNNELGLPQMILRIRDEHEIAVLEMGISDFGEMHRLAKIARPNVCVITNIGVAHLENLRDRDGILRAKSEIFDFFPSDGAVVLNGDDDKLALIKEVRGVAPIRYGLREGLDYRAYELREEGLAGTSCRIRTPRGEMNAVVPAPGEHMVTNALAGAAVGELFGMTLDEIREGIRTYVPISGRFRVIRSKYTVVDDCYNANPISMKASLEVLAGTEGRRVAILGDMGELGANEKELHANVGRAISRMGLDLLLAAGPLCAALVAEAKKDPKLRAAHFETREELQAVLEDHLRPGDTVLVKASHFMKFDEIVNQLCGDRAAD